MPAAGFLQLCLRPCPGMPAAGFLQLMFRPCPGMPAAARCGLGAHVFATSSPRGETPSPPQLDSKHADKRPAAKGGSSPLLRQALMQRLDHLDVAPPDRPGVHQSDPAWHLVIVTWRNPTFGGSRPSALWQRLQSKRAAKACLRSSQGCRAGSSEWGAAPLPPPKVAAQAADRG